jgi:putative nucleotidyltransferase with HDIG domain
MQALSQLNLPADLHDIVVNQHNNHKETKYHKEGLLDHLQTCADTCKELAPVFGVNRETAYWTGFLHDIGKPLACRHIKKRSIFIGHAQLGANLAHHILHRFAPALVDNEDKDAILWCVDNHMCCCAHQQSQEHIIKKFSPMLLLTVSDLQKNISVRLLCLLFAADSISKISDIPVDREATIQHSLGLLETLKHKLSNTTPFVHQVSKLRNITNERVIVHLLGLSGSGKSTACQHIINSLSQFKISHVERDTCYYEVAKELGIPDGCSYKQTHDFITEQHAKDRVQKRWVEKLTDALEDKSHQLILIDTVQALYPYGWNGTLEALSEEAKANYASSLKVGLYCIPLHQLGIDFESKIGVFTQLPEQQLFWPNVNLELGETNPNFLDIGTGLLSSVLSVSERFLSVNLIPAAQPQTDLLRYIEKCGSLEKAIADFPSNVLLTATEYDEKDVKIVTVCYNDGMQTFTADTRDYRGETLLIKNNEYFLLRGSLPVFPDYASIEKDPRVFPYIKDIWEQALPERQVWKDKFPTLTAKLAVTYKFDGSLFNLVYIPSSSELYETLVEITAKVDCLTNVISGGLLVYGSKGRFMLHPANNVRRRILNAIHGSYGSREAFCEEVSRFLATKDLQPHECVTMHFEAIDKIPSSELTVYYGRAWCPFFGYTVFSNVKANSKEASKRFYLPTQADFSKSQTPIFWFDTWTDVLTFSKQNYEKLLDGDTTIEPEGYVVHMFTDSGEWMPVKLKYDFYYVAHKPNTKMNKEKSKAMWEEEKYSKIRTRLAKFRDKPSIAQCLENAKIKEVLDEFYVGAPMETRKDFAIWCHQEDKKKDIDEISCRIIQAMKEHYYLRKINLFAVIMCLYPDKLTVSMLETHLNGISNK